MWEGVKVMTYIKRFFNQSKILVLLLVALAASIALNVYFYFETIKPSHTYVTGTFIDRSIQGGMGRVMIGIDNPPFGGLMLPTGGNFSVFVSISLWEPYAGSGTYSFSFKLYECTPHNEYPDTPIAEKTVTTQKDKNAMSIGAYTTFAITIPADPGVYIYKVVIGGEYDYEVEFPIIAE